MKTTLVALLFLLANIYAQTEQNLTLSLEQAKAFALKNNPNYQIQVKKIDAQKGVYWSDIMPENPEIGVEVEAIPEGEVYNNYEEKRLFISQSIDFPTNYFFRHRLLKAEILQERIRLEKVRRELFLNVKMAYFNLLLKNELSKLALKNLELSQDFYDRAKQSYELGESDRLTMLKAKVNWGTAQKRLHAAQKDVQTGLTKLREILGVKNHESIRIVLTDSLPETIVSISHDLLKNSLKKHPALKMAQLSQQATRNAKQLAYGQFLPKISLSYFKQEIAKRKFWGGEIGLTFPLWFMAPKGQVEQKKAEQSMANHFYIAEQLRLQKEFDQAISQLEKAANEVKLFQTELLAEAEEVFRIAQQSYGLGEIGYLQYIDAQQTLIQTREEYLYSLYHYQIEKANLTKLTGVEL